MAQITCNNCGAILEFDIKKVEYPGGLKSHEDILCPCCGAFVTKS